jgi:ATP-dependent Clp protease ATP-binding subunit ClpC
MFERYTESARRVLFFARYEASAARSLSIESEHMLLGLVREPGPIVRRLLAGAEARIEQLNQELENRTASRERVSMSVELPFSEQTKRILTYTAEEADSLGHSDIGTEHILLALLRLPESGAGAILTGHGLRLQTAREAVVAVRAEGVPSTSSRTGKDTPESVTLARTVSVPQPAGARVDTEGIISDIERIQRLVQRIVMTLPAPHESTELLHLLHIELDSLRGRFS